MYPTHVVVSKKDEVLCLEVLVNSIMWKGRKPIDAQVLRYERLNSQIVQQRPSPNDLQSLQTDQAVLLCELLSYTNKEPNLPCLSSAQDDVSCYAEGLPSPEWRLRCNCSSSSNRFFELCDAGDWERKQSRRIWPRKGSRKNRKLMVNSQEDLIKLASDVLQTTIDELDIKWWSFSILHGKVCLKTLLHCNK